MKYLVLILVAFSVQAFAKNSKSALPKQLIDRSSMQITTFSDGEYDYNVIKKGESVYTSYYQNFEEPFQELLNSNNEDKVRLKGTLETVDEKGAIVKKDLKGCLLNDPYKKFHQEDGLRSVVYSFHVVCPNHQPISLGKLFHFEWLSQEKSYYGINQRENNQFQVVMDTPASEWHYGIYYSLGGKNNMTPVRQVVTEVQINEQNEFSVLKIEVLDKAQKTKLSLELQ